MESNSGRWDSIQTLDPWPRSRHQLPYSSQTTQAKVSLNGKSPSFTLGIWILLDWFVTNLTCNLENSVYGLPNPTKPSSQTFAQNVDKSDL